MNEPWVPISITANRKTGELTITWNDGHVSVYPFVLLRNACPCAECRGGHEEILEEAESAHLPFGSTGEDSPATRLKNITAVGNYAVNIEWEDGHQFGIYNWDYLRRLCPCPQCQPKGSGRDN